MYHLAALYAAWGRPAEAFEHLAKAVALEPERVLQWVESDRMFDRLRDEPEFARILA